jgi:hypothetical protein
MENILGMQITIERYMGTSIRNIKNYGASITPRGRSPKSTGK